MDNRKESEIFSPLIGNQLSSICFVQDYMQLDFDGHRLTTYTLPTLWIRDIHIEYTHEKYKNEICSLITYKVKNVVYIDNEVVEIIFENINYKITIKLDEEVDNVYYTDHEDRWFVI